MAKNSRHRWAVLFSRDHNPSIKDFSAVTSYWFTVAMEEIEFYFLSRRAGHQWLQRRVEGWGTHTVRIFTEISTIFQRLTGL